MITKLKVLEAFPAKMDNGIWDFVRPGRVIEIEDRSYARSLIDRGKVSEI